MNKKTVSFQSVFITGASSGIGAALARAYADKGVFLFLCGRNEQRLNEVAETCRQKGAEVYTFIFDVINANDVRDALRKSNSIRSLDLVIANAGVSNGILGMCENIHATNTIMQTNIFGVVNTVLPALELFKFKGCGQIALMSSMAGYRGLSNCPAYSASKNCVKAWGEALRGVWAREQIKINVICPGFIKTPLTDANAFCMPFIMEADKAATIIQRGIAKNKAIIAFPSVMAFAAWLGSCLPSFILHPILRMLPQKEK